MEQYFKKPVLNATMDIILIRYANYIIFKIVWKQ